MPSTAPEGGPGRIPPAAEGAVHVAVGVLRRHREVLLTRRLDGTHLAGCWEFPGGKLEAGETPAQALARELHEELGIAVGSAQPLIRHRHAYPTRTVVLHAFEVGAWRGEPRGRHGQALRWVDPDAIDPRDLPPADGPLLSAARLPDVYAITADFAGDRTDFLGRIDRLIERGVRLLCLRSPGLPPAAYRALAEDVLARARPAGLPVLLHGAADWLFELVPSLGAAGVHLPARALEQLTARPLAAGLWCAASCHDAVELNRAARIGCDFAVLSPVAVTASHPAQPPLGWARFATLAQPAAVPVYALGGMTPADAITARRHGGQGVAVLRGLWEQP